MNSQAASFLISTENWLLTRGERFSYDTVVAMTMGTSHSFLVTDTLAKDTHRVETWDH